MDRKTAKLNGSFYDRWVADIASTNDAYPYGMPMNGRTTEHTWSRQSFNGQQKDDEVYGKGNMTTALHWQYDARIGPQGRWNRDPKPNPSVSPYATFNGNPILFSDVLGDTTSFYLSTATKPFLVLNDKNQNSLTIIDANNESVALSIVDMYKFMGIEEWKDDKKITMASNHIRQLGITYDLDAIADFDNKHNGTGAPATEFSFESLVGATDFTLNGKPFTPTGEVIARMILQNGIATPGKPDKTSTSVNQSVTPDFGEDNQLPVTIHLHPPSGKFTWTIVEKGIPVLRSGPLKYGISPADRRVHPSFDQGARSVIVDDGKIILHNKRSSQDITVDKPKR